MSPPVDDDHDARPDRHLLELALEPRHVPMVEAHGFAVGQLRAVHDGRVIELVEEHDVAPTHEAGDQAEVRLIAGREDEACFFAEELRQLGLEPAVQLQCPVEKPAAGAAGPEFVERLFRRGEHLGVMRQPEIVIGAHHDARLAFDHHDRVFRL